MTLIKENLPHGKFCLSKNEQQKCWQGNLFLSPGKLSHFWQSKCGTRKDLKIKKCPGRLGSKSFSLLLLFCKGRMFIISRTFGVFGIAHLDIYFTSTERWFKEFFFTIRTRVLTISCFSYHNHFNKNTLISSKIKKIQKQK